MIESLQPDAETPRWRQSGRLLRAPDGLQLAEAGEILTAARRRAQELLEEAAAQGERERAQARQEGWLEGRNAAADRLLAGEAALVALEAAAATPLPAPATVPAPTR